MPMPDRKVPGLAAHLGDGARGEGFGKFVDYVGKIMADGAFPDAGPREKAMIRIMTTMCIAAIEACRKEDAIGTPREDIIQLIGRGAGAAAAAAVQSVLDDSAPQKLVRRLLREELLTGAYWFIDAQYDTGRKPRP